MTLNLAPGLVLPDEAVTMAGVIVGQRGTGKTNTAMVEVEAAHGAGYVSALVDPTGVGWGLRHGKNPTDHVLFGGFRGAEPDLPLREQDGREIARLVAEDRVPCVLGLRHLRKGAQLRFATEFFEELYHLNTQPLLLVVDEAWRFAPAKMTDSERGGYGARCLGALVDIVGMGRVGGLGIRLISQRMVKIHADAREQCEIVVAHRLMGSNDRKTIKDWLSDIGDDEQQAHAQQLLGRIPNFKKPGQAVIYAPSLGVLDEFQVRPRETFDSSATPKHGRGVTEPPKGRSTIDLDAYRSRLAEVVEEAKANDPVELRKEIDRLKAKLAEQPSAEPEQVEVEVRVEVVPVGVRESALAVQERLSAAVAAADGLADALMAVAADPAVERVVAPTPARAPVAAPAAPVRRAPSSNGASATPKLGVAQRKILTVLAQHPDGRTKRQLALETGYSERGGGFNNPLGSLRSQGLVTPARVDPIQATAEGLAALGDYEPLPRGSELLEHWCREVGGPGRGILLALAEEGPMDKARLAVRAGEIARAEPYEPSGGGFNNPLGRLRTLCLVGRGQPIALTEEFAEAIR